MNAKQPGNFGPGFIATLYHFDGLSSLMGSQFWQPTAYPAPFPCGLQSQAGAVPDHASLEFSKCAPHMEHHPDRSCCRLDWFHQPAEPGPTVHLACSTIRALSITELA